MLRGWYVSGSHLCGDIKNDDRYEFTRIRVFALREDMTTARGVILRENYFLTDEPKDTKKEFDYCSKEDILYKIEVELDQKNIDSFFGKEKTLKALKGIRMIRPAKVNQ